ncbi:hypothetical protein ACRQ5Q_15130 [Bradyrhizobium sp. PMVTL-01]|uniref:hypothetical protein n=1 Tax=Bradyrhizobium sp. PMVTL-01 TaxID=3434999 RepID=UPI003F70179A
MADLTDVTAYLAQQVAAAVYPNGTSSPSVAGMDCRIFEGWPLADQLDLDLAGYRMDNSQNPPVKVKRPGGPCANVSIFPMLGQGAPTYQILDETYVITPPPIGLAFTLSGNTITVSGQPAPGEFLTVICDDAVVVSQTGATAQALLAALAAEAQPHYPAASSTATTLTIPVGHSIVVRQGGEGVMGKVTHRQKQSIMITVWAPNQVVRKALASAIDVAIKSKSKITLPVDTSQATVFYSRTNTIDEEQAKGLWRRDLIFDVTYATVEKFDGFTITSTKVTIANPDGSAIATALT